MRRNRGANGGARLHNAETAVGGGAKYLFALAIICQVYLLVDSQSSVSLYSFKILNLNLIMYCILNGYIFLNELCMKSYAYIGVYTQFCTATGLQDSSPEEPKMHQNSC